MSALSGWSFRKGWSGSVELPAFERQPPPRVQHIKSGFYCCARCADGLDTAARCTTLAELELIRVVADDMLAHRKVGGCVLDVEDELAWRLKMARYHETNTNKRRGLLARLTDALRRRS